LRVAQPARAEACLARGEVEVRGAEDGEDARHHPTIAQAIRVEPVGERDGRSLVRRQVPMGALD